MVAISFWLTQFSFIFNIKSNKPWYVSHVD